MTQFALRWILMFDAVTCAIPAESVRTRLRRLQSVRFARDSDGSDAEGEGDL